MTSRAPYQHLGYWRHRGCVCHNAWCFNEAVATIAPEWLNWCTIRHRNLFSNIFPRSYRTTLLVKDSCSYRGSVKISLFGILTKIGIWEQNGSVPLSAVIFDPQWCVIVHWKDDWKQQTMVYHASKSVLPFMTSAPDSCIESCCIIIEICCQTQMVT